MIVPAVLAIGGYLFTRAENERTRQSADEQRKLDREIADQRTNEDRRIAQERTRSDHEIAEQRRQDNILQACLDHIGGLLLDKDTPLRQSEEGDEVRALARARTVNMLATLDGYRKGNVVVFLYESGLIAKDHVYVDLRGADLREAVLRGDQLPKANLRAANLGTADLAMADLHEADLVDADLNSADLSHANLEGTSLPGADLSDANLDRFLGVTNEELYQQAASLKGATMPNGQEYEEWLKSREGEER